MSKQSAFIALGSNLPFDGAPPPRLLARAVTAMQNADLSLHALSGIWETAAWPPSDQPDYYNAIVELDLADLSPQPLYAKLSAIEMRFGRERRQKWAPRTLDLDIIAIGEMSGGFGGITLPHPHMHERAFVLAPLVEIAPTWRHPVLGQTALDLLAALPSGGRYQRVSDLGPEPG